MAGRTNLCLHVLCITKRFRRHNTRELGTLGKRETFLEAVWKKKVERLRDDHIVHRGFRKDLRSDTSRGKCMV